jgi:hypothetical protein
MSGQDATLSIKEAKAQQDRTSADNQMHQGPKKKGGMGHTELCEKVAQQGK